MIELILRSCLFDNASVLAGNITITGSLYQQENSKEEDNDMYCCFGTGDHCSRISLDLAYLSTGKCFPDTEPCPHGPEQLHYIGSRTWICR